MSSLRISSQSIIGIAIVVVGLLLLLNAFGIAGVGTAMKWIPSIFIVYGILRLLFARFSQPMGPIVTIGALPAESTSLVEGSFRGTGAEVTTVRSGDKTDLSIGMKGQGISFLRNLGDTEWDVYLSQKPDMTLKINSGASSAFLDLRDLELSDISIDVGASDIEIVMPALAGHVTADIDAGAADVNIVIPEGVAARISANTGVSSLSIDAIRFPRNGNEYLSPDFYDAVNRVDIEIDSGASSIAVH